MKHLRRRVESIQKMIAPPRRDDTMTLVELMRIIWDGDRAHYMKLVEEGSSEARILLPMFEREDRAIQQGRRSR